MAKPIRLTAYAKAKLIFFEEHRFHMDEATIVRAVREPERVSRGGLGRWFAQRTLSERHLLRVIYEESP